MNITAFKNFVYALGTLVFLICLIGALRSMALCQYGSAGILMLSISIPLSVVIYHLFQNFDEQ